MFFGARLPPQIREIKLNTVYAPSLPTSILVEINYWEGSMNWLWVIVIGLVVGALAKLLMPGKDPGGFIVTTLLGVAGSVVATTLGRAIGWYHEGQSAGFIMSVIGAVVLLAIYHAVIRRRSVIRT
jgi:uncharacterized membrane protein YeaQ/YmgE (transglycosylase-associated protein family)